MQFRTITFVFLAEDFGIYEASVGQQIQFEHNYFSNTAYVSCG